jgi:competence protein ComEA
MRKNSLLRGTWKDYFNFPKRLRKALYALFVVMILEIAFLIYMHYKPSTSQPFDTNKFQKEIDEFYSSIDSTHKAAGFSESGNLTEKKYSKENIKAIAELFAFNPNNLPEEDWKRLGFSDRQVHVIKNYEAKGGKFRTKADVKKMYCISEKEYAIIEPYIIIPEQVKDSASKPVYKKYERTNLIVDIGIADTVELLKLPAIGPAFARRISNYREKLGGFYSVNQLKEVWGLTDSIFQIINPHVSLKDSTNLKKINVNTATYHDFNIHPYIDNSLASAIVSYRNKHGPFHNKEDLRKVSLLNEELYTKLAPYLKIE